MQGNAFFIRYNGKTCWAEVQQYSSLTSNDTADQSTKMHTKYNNHISITLTATASLKPFSFSALLVFPLAARMTSLALTSLASSTRYRPGHISRRRSEMASAEALSPWYLLAV